APAPKTCPAPRPGFSSPGWLCWVGLSWPQEMGREKGLLQGEWVSESVLSNWPSLIKGWKSLEEEGDDGLDAGPVGGISVGKVPQHKGFFLGKFDPQGGPPAQTPEPGAKLSARDGSAQTPAEQAGIDGMPGEAVGAIV